MKEKVSFGRRGKENKDVMSDQYQINPQLQGGSYGFPQYYAANQMSNLSYQTQAIVGAQNEMMMQAFTMPTMIPPPGNGRPGAPGLEPGVGLTQGSVGGVKAKSSRAGAKSKLSAKKKPKKKPKKKVSHTSEEENCLSYQSIGHLLSNYNVFSPSLNFSFWKPKKKKPKKKKPKKKKPKKKKPKKKKVAKKKVLKPKPKITKNGKKKKEKDPTAPKRARTAFNFFLDDFRQQFKIDNPNTKGIVEVTKAGSAAWKVLDPEKRKVYEDKAELSQKEYAEAKKKYVENGGPTMFKYVSGPHRPPTAYFIFLANFRKEYLAEHPGVKGVSDISKGAGLKWRSLSPEERETFEKKGKAVKEEYYRIKAMTTEERIAYLALDKDPYARFF